MRGVSRLRVRGTRTWTGSFGLGREKGWRGWEYLGMGGAVLCRRAAPSTGVNARLDGRRRRCAARRTACAPRASSATSRSSRCRGPTSCPQRPMASRSARSVQPSSDLADPRHSPICLDSMPRGRLGSPQHRPRGRAGRRSFANDADLRNGTAVSFRTLSAPSRRYCPAAGIARRAPEATRMRQLRRRCAGLRSVTSLPGQLAHT